jgi:cytosine/adenosine deaminase-related metal-dependent hydrolase
MAVRQKPFDPLLSPKLVLEGRIVTMDGAFRVMPRGRVYTQDGGIVAVQEAAAPAPPGFEAAPVTTTGGTIYPGLIDLHNHLPYNVLPLWQVPRQFTNRGQWSRHAGYHAKVSAPMQTLAATEQLLASICRYVETKALIGGTTTGQGITLANQSGIRRYFKGMVRNVEATDDDTLPEVFTRVPDVAAREVKAFFTRLKQEKTCYLLHLSEGLDAVARQAFESLQLAPGQWAITPSLCAIHAAALKPQDFQTLAANGGSMVWSPFSNMLLYGGTADVAAAKAAGVPIALGCDWAPSGSKNLLGELKVAHLWSEAHAIFSPRELVGLVTSNAARLLKWHAVLGSIEAGKRADLVVADGVAGDPYLQLIHAKESDLTLVMINGVARFGAERLMRKLGLVGERMKVGGASRMLFLAHPNADPMVEGLTLAAARDALKGALRGLPALASRAERPKPLADAAHSGSESAWHLVLDEIIDTGVDMRFNLPARPAVGQSPAATLMRAPMAAGPQALSSVVTPLNIDPLTVVDDAGYLDAIDAQLNLPPLIKEGLRELWG